VKKNKFGKYLISYLICICSIFNVFCKDVTESNQKVEQSSEQSTNATDNVTGDDIVKVPAKSDIADVKIKTDSAPITEDPGITDAKTPENTDPKVDLKSESGPIIEQSSEQSTNTTVNVPAKSDITEEDPGIADTKTPEDIDPKVDFKDEVEAVEDETGDLELLDQVEAEVVLMNSDEIDPVVITKQDIERRGFDGNKYKLEDLTDESLADQYGRKILKIPISNEDANRNLKKMGLTEKNIDAIIENWNFPSRDSFVDDIKKMYIANGAFSYEVESHVVITEADIKKCYDENPVYRQASYLIESAFVPENEEPADNKSVIKKELNDFAQNLRSKPDYLVWNEPVEINESEITEENKFIHDMQMGAIYVHENPNGFNVFNLKVKKPKCLVPLEDRHMEILMMLKKKIYPEATAKAKQRFRDQALIYMPAQFFKVPCWSKEL